MKGKRRREGRRRRRWRERLTVEGRARSGSGEGDWKGGRSGKEVVSVKRSIKWILKRWRKWRRCVWCYSLFHHKGNDYDVEGKVERRKEGQERVREGI